MKFLETSRQNPQKKAIIDEWGTYTYAQLEQASSNIGQLLLNGEKDLKESRVAFLCPPSFEYVATQWAVWRSGGIAVPLCTQHPKSEMSYVIDDSQATILVAHPLYEDILNELAEEKGIRLILLEDIKLDIPNTTSFPSIDPKRRAMILYTSGTTGKPKGVVSTHQNINAQVDCLIKAWEWTADDHILHVLPLHHTHGIINKLCCAMWSGATCQFMSKFNAVEVWGQIATQQISLFMAVPTIYKRLITARNKADRSSHRQLKAACEKMRLMVSGSAALPVSTLEEWREISGHTLLERYGMTEIGMALSNSYREERIPGFVGRPLPGVETRIVDENNTLVAEGEIGELQVKGPNVFLEYWNRPEATQDAFVDGWFKTGDIVQIINGNYKIVGRNSVDIIKSGGYKISALEIEEVLRTHPDIAECAIVGVADEDWGERVCAALVMRTDQEITVEELKLWAKDKLAPYKIPSKVKCVPALVSNVMGKVTKPALKLLF